jgi:hypothetical protein
LTCKGTLRQVYPWNKLPYKHQSKMSLSKKGEM